ncbi:glycosyltransferase [Streptomyces sp. NBC_00078]|uniref:glycosyltransferase n=1 Tax=unclassified Streptomyces TaxID=2593676 RepID=UPI0022585058|nr:glycosyltransferase [Streptomyces sp. NBC_00078]MCX5421955.1 hypothetical protein [Streptomyces sp. NBC_00078]
MTSTGFDRRLAALGKPSVLIPLATSAGNEQEHNALHLQQADAAVALVKKVVTPEGLRASVGPILASPEQRRHTAQQARTLGRPDAADRLTEVLLSVAV